MKQTNKEFERANEDKFGAFGMHAAPGKIASSFRWGGEGAMGRDAREPARNVACTSCWSFFRLLIKQAPALISPC